MSKTTKLCPSCSSATEKNGGCNHMYVIFYALVASDVVVVSYIHRVCVLYRFVPWVM
jgi:hypothetical protein